jgi:hypothetical protein
MIGLHQLNSEQYTAVINAPIFRRWGYREGGRLNSFELSVLEVDELMQTERMLVITSFWDWSWTVWFEIFLHAGSLFAWVFLLRMLFSPVVIYATSGAQSIESWQLWALTWFAGHGALNFFAGGGVISYYLATFFFPTIPSYIAFVRWFHSWFTLGGLFFS